MTVWGVCSDGQQNATIDISGGAIVETKLLPFDAALPWTGMENRGHRREVCLCRRSFKYLFDHSKIRFNPSLLKPRGPIGCQPSSSRLSARKSNQNRIVDLSKSTLSGRLARCAAAPRASWPSCTVVVPPSGHRAPVLIRYRYRGLIAGLESVSISSPIVHGLPDGA